MTNIYAIPLLVAASLSGAAVAAPVDNYAVSAISNARYVNAVAMLEGAVKADRADETAWINLAVAYRHTGRFAQAVAAYRRVLTLDNVELDTADGKAMWSHDVARAGLALPVAQTVASAR